ncbi:hypothetical protein [Cellulomonas sp. S1-8]|uniref:hypothetical protein n=1 Tax=Cellulomonas sp. S1-8 TaxID=2904790 RepID=UPI002243DE53|nr:hypothetical protein [Cellulomonas sp. S1-8]UZN03773.1 hypothetical protein OKX07_02195 [Cellulomonas sp. S1-8]
MTRVWVHVEAAELELLAEPGRRPTLPFVDSSREIFRHLPFPFEGGRFPSDLGAVVQRTVLSGEQPAREVVHAPDGSWLVGDGVNDPNVPGASTVTHLVHAYDAHRWNTTIAELAGMPPGRIATRPGPGAPWTIALLEGWDD